MHHKNLVLALLLAASLSAFLSACGGGSDDGAGDQTLRTTFARQVTFGDSLSDVGTYAVGTVLALGGGRYTINGNNTTLNPALTGKTWTELMAAQFGLPAPCPAQTGLDGDPAQGFSVPVTNHPNCFGYAQGGARVTNPIGTGHRLTGSPLGELTVPVVTQVATHLAKTGGRFSGTEIVFVTAGGNDALALLGQLQAGATAAGEAAGAAEGARVGAETFAATLAGSLAAGAADPQAAGAAIGAAMLAESRRAGSTGESIAGVAIATAAAQPGNQAVGSPAVYGPMVARAQSAAQQAGAAAGAAAGARAGAAFAAAQGPAMIAAMTAAGAELSAIVTTQIVARGANYVVVNNLPDLGSSPAGKAQDANTQVLINAMVGAFNSALKSGVSGEAKVLYVDLFAVSHDQIINPAPYGLSNTSTPACGPNELQGYSLVCRAANLTGGDVSRYMFADDVHPTPFEHALIARYVAQQMIIKGWL